MSPARLHVEIRNFVARRASGCCEYCLSQADFCPDPFSVEHITPVVNEGGNDTSNLAYCCQGCNNHKFTSTVAKDISTGEMVALYNPRQQVWSEHFVWNEDFSILLGISPTGRASIRKLRLNRQSVVNLRRVLFITGYHPITPPRYYQEG